MHCSANGMHAFEVPFCMVYNFIINIHFNVMHVCFVDSCWTYRHSQESTNVYVDVHLVIYEEDHTDKSRSLDRSMVPDKVFFSSLYCFFFSHCARSFDSSHFEMCLFHFIFPPLSPCILSIQCLPTSILA